MLPAHRNHALGHLLRKKVLCHIGGMSCCRAVQVCADLAALKQYVVSAAWSSSNCSGLPCPRGGLFILAQRSCVPKTLAGMQYGAEQLTSQLSLVEHAARDILYASPVPALA